MCEKCTEVQEGSTKKPFCPPRGTVNDLSYRAPCGKMWLQFNQHYHLWQPVTDKEWEHWKDNLCDPPGDVCY